MNLISKKKYLVIGLGTFGRTMANALAEDNHYVVAIDKDINKVEQIKDNVAESVSFDATQTNLLHKFGATDVNIAVIAIGDNFKAAEFIALALRDSGVPQIFLTVNSDQEGKIIQEIGIADVINPQQQAAQKLAREISPELG